MLFYVPPNFEILATPLFPPPPLYKQPPISLYLSLKGLTSLISSSSLCHSLRMACYLLHLFGLIFWGLFFLAGFGKVLCYNPNVVGVVQGTAVVNGNFPIAMVDDDFVCATLDWWPPEKCDYGTCSWGLASLLNLVRILISLLGIFWCGFFMALMMVVFFWDLVVIWDMGIWYSFRCNAFWIWLYELMLFLVCFIVLFYVWFICWVLTI